MLMNLATPSKCWVLLVIMAKRTVVIFCLLYTSSARYSSPLSVDDFVKRSSYIYYTQEALAKAAHDIEVFASREGLDAHANSIKIRTVEEE